jgi:hypothetical protein
MEENLVKTCNIHGGNKKWLDFSILGSDMWVDTDVSEECASSIFRVKKLTSPRWHCSDWGDDVIQLLWWVARNVASQCHVNG